MKISIITSVYNNKDTIAESIESVLSQTYDNIEYIVVDGASTDGTLKIIKQYQDKISTFISEPDKGIYDGLNKGIKLATGDVVGFLHSDDLYQNNRVIETIAQTFKDNQVDSIYGDLIYVRQHDTSKVVRYWKSGNFSLKKLNQGWMPPHPTFFVKRKKYEVFDSFDTRFKIAADYDCILRLLGKHLITTYYIPKILIKMRVGGESNKSIKNLFLKSMEDIKALKKNGIGHHPTSIIIKNLSKIPQFLIKK
jgi:glycosyltransferase